MLILKDKQLPSKLSRHKILRLGRDKCYQKLERKGIKVHFAQRHTVYINKLLTIKLHLVSTLYITGYHKTSVHNYCLDLRSILPYMAVAIGRLLRIINITETDPLGVQLCALTYFHQMTSKIKISQFKKKLKKHVLQFYH